MVDLNQARAMAEQKIGVEDLEAVMLDGDRVKYALTTEQPREDLEYVANWRWLETAELVDGEWDDGSASDDEIVRAKWTIDGSATLAEAAKKAHEFSVYLLNLHEAGYVLRQPIEDDYGFYFKQQDRSA